MRSKQSSSIRALVIGASSGGLKVLMEILPQLPKQFDFPVFIVTHQKDSGKHYLTDILDDICPLTVHEAEDKMSFLAGHIYVAPSGYHLLIESVNEIALSMDEPLHACRPSVDVLFASAVDEFGSGVMGVLLTGMGCDGADGLLEIHKAGGVCAVQDPHQAEFASMPEAAISKVPSAEIFSVEMFGVCLNKFI